MILPVSEFPLLCLCPVNKYLQGIYSITCRAVCRPVALWVLVSHVDMVFLIRTTYFHCVFVFVSVVSYKETASPSKVNSHAEVSAHLTSLTLPGKAESVVSLTSQCSYSSTIVHVGDKKPQPELGTHVGSLTMSRAI